MIPLTAIAGSASLFLFLMWYMRSKNESDTRIRSLGGISNVMVNRKRVEESPADYDRGVVKPLLRKLLATAAGHRLAVRAQHLDDLEQAFGSSHFPIPTRITADIMLSAASV